MKQALKRQLKHIPEQQRVIFERMFEKHPDVFEDMMRDMQEKKKAGMDESLAMMSIMRKYEKRLRAIASTL